MSKRKRRWPPSEPGHACRECRTVVRASWLSPDGRCPTCVDQVPLFDPEVTR